MKKGKTRRKGKIKQGRIFITTLIVLFALFTHSKVQQYKMTKDIMAEKIKIESEIDRINQDIESLDGDIGNSQSLEFIEKTAREDYNMVKPREIIYIFEETTTESKK